MLVLIFSSLFAKGLAYGQVNPEPKPFIGLGDLFKSGVEDLPANCEVCAHFYRVHWGLHQFVGAKVTHGCPGNHGDPKMRDIDLHVFGLANADDESNFEGLLEDERSNIKRKAKDEVLISLGQNCGEKARNALTDSARITKEAYERYFNSTAVILARQLVTPIFGRPCKNTEQDVEDAIFYDAFKDRSVADSIYAKLQRMSW